MLGQLMEIAVNNLKKNMKLIWISTSGFTTSRVLLPLVNREIRDNIIEQ